MDMDIMDNIVYTFTHKNIIHICNATFTRMFFQETADGTNLRKSKYRFTFQIIVHE